MGLHKAQTISEHAVLVRVCAAHAVRMRSGIAKQRCDAEPHTLFGAWGEQVLKRAHVSE